MSKASFTPGPWDSHGEDEVMSGDWDKHIATAWNNDKISPDEATANARLIAAAPALYAALQTCLHRLSVSGRDEDEAIEEARAALKLVEAPDA